MGVPVWQSVEERAQALSGPLRGERTVSRLPVERSSRTTNAGPPQLPLRKRHRSGPEVTSLVDSKRGRAHYKDWFRKRMLDSNDTSASTMTNVRIRAWATWFLVRFIKAW